MGRFVQLLFIAALELSYVTSFVEASVVHSLKPALKPKGVCDIDLDNDIVILNYRGINCTERANVNDENIGQATGYPVMGFSMDGETCYQGTMSDPSSDYPWTEGRVYVEPQTCPHSVHPDKLVLRYDEYPEWPSGRSTGSPTGTGRVFTQCDAVNGAVSKSFGPGTTNCDGTAVETADTTIFWGMKGSYQMTGDPISDNDGMMPGECVNSWGDHISGFEYSSKLYCPGTLAEIPSDFLHYMEPHAAACCPFRNVTNTCDCKDYDSTSHASIQWFHVNGEGCLDENVYSQPNPFVWFPDVSGACIDIPNMEMGARSMEWIGCADDGSAKLHFYWDHDCLGPYEKVNAIENECYDDRFIVRCHGNNNTLWNTKSECYAPPPFVNLTLQGNVSVSDDTASTVSNITTADVAVNSTATETALVSDVNVTTVTDTTTTVTDMSTETSTSTISNTEETGTVTSTVAPASSAFGVKSSLVSVFGMVGLKRMTSPMGIIGVGVMLVWSVKGMPIEQAVGNFSNGDLGNSYFETGVYNYRRRPGFYKQYSMYKPPWAWDSFDLCLYDPSKDYLEIIHATDSCGCASGAVDLDSSQIIAWRKDIQLRSTYVEQLWGDSGGCMKIVDCDADTGVLASYYDLEKDCDGDIGAADGDDDWDSVQYSWFRFSGGAYEGGSYKGGNYGWRNSSWVHESSAFVSLGKAIDVSTGDETNAVNAPCRDLGCRRNIVWPSGTVSSSRHCEWTQDKLFAASYWCELGKKPSWLVPTHADFNVKHGCSGVPVSGFGEIYILYYYAYNYTSWCGHNYINELREIDPPVRDYNETLGDGAVAYYGYSDCYSFKWMWHFHPGICSWSGHSWDWKSFRASCVNSPGRSESADPDRVDVEWFSGETCAPGHEGTQRFPLDFGTVNRVGNKIVKYETFAANVCQPVGLAQYNLSFKYGYVRDYDLHGARVWTCPGTRSPACPSSGGIKTRPRTNFTGFTEKVKY